MADLVWKCGFFLMFRRKNCYFLIGQIQTVKSYIISKHLLPNSSLKLTCKYFHRKNSLKSLLKIYILDFFSQISFEYFLHIALLYNEGLRGVFSWEIVIYLIFWGTCFINIPLWCNIIHRHTQMWKLTN